MINAMIKCLFGYHQVETTESISFPGVNVKYCKACGRLLGEDDGR